MKKGNDYVMLGYVSFEKWLRERLSIPHPFTHSFPPTPTPCNIYANGVAQDLHMQELYQAFSVAIYMPAMLARVMHCKNCAKDLCPNQLVRILQRGNFGVRMGKNVVLQPLYNHYTPHITTIIQPTHVALPTSV